MLNVIFYFLGILKLDTYCDCALYQLVELKKHSIKGYYLLKITENQHSEKNNLL